MRIFDFEVIYKGNINRNFYLYCLKQDWKLIKYLFFFVFYFIGSLFFEKIKRKYVVNKYKYFSDISNLTKVVNSFYDKYKSKIEKSYMNITDKDIIIALYPEILIKPFLKNEKYIAYELDKNNNVMLNSFEEKLRVIKNEEDVKGFVNIKSQGLIGLCDEFCLISNKTYTKKTYERKQKLYRVLFILVCMIILPLLITLMSFAYANAVVDMKIVSTYFEDIKLLALNFLPIFLLFNILFLVSKRLYVSFGITSILVLIIGIINQTKLTYRDDFFLFEDVLLFKEALIMTNRYSIVITWYSIVVMIMIFFGVLFFKRKVNKLMINRFLRWSLLLVLVFASYYSYKNILINEKIYNSVGDLTVVNRWIATRQYQVRGLVYPFVYTSRGFIKTPPEGYDENIAKELIASYEYENIPENQKVNIIAIMLEAYNDFSKFETIDFTEDIYAPFHAIQEKSYSGEIVTNVFGGGTINTERLFLSGYYNMPNFRKATNSYPRYFKEQGYYVEAMHPIYGAFYNRNTANLNMGFDNYWNYENKFKAVDTTFLKDWKFFNYIIEGYEKSVSEGVPYFNFSVTYQNHGPYSSKLNSSGNTYFSKAGYTEANYNIINNYFDGIKQTNLALEKLINYFENEDEPVVVIFFGDHNPYLGDGNVSYEEMGIDMSLQGVDGMLNYYATPYVMYANESAKDALGRDFVGEGNTISPIFLMNEFFDYVGWKGNEYLQYTSDVKKNIDVIHSIYYKENGEYVLRSKANRQLITEFNYVSYFWWNSKVKST